MKAETFQELDEFHRFVGEKIAIGQTSLSPEQVLDEWREFHTDEALTEEDFVAIQEAIDDINKGDVGIPYNEFDLIFRAKWNLPARQG